MLVASVCLFVCLFVCLWQLLSQKVLSKQISHLHVIMGQGILHRTHPLTWMRVEGQGHRGQICANFKFAVDGANLKKRLIFQFSSYGVGQARRSVRECPLLVDLGQRSRSQWAVEKKNFTQKFFTIIFFRLWVKIR